ncbi:MAG: cache domain-containing protein, partial [Bacillota bacterium]|nr:cache domain-containing protein [Bacillota bacterium]
MMKKKKRVGIGIKLGIVIASVLFVALGIRTAFDGINNYRQELENRTDYELNIAHSNSSDIEWIFAGATTSAHQLRDYIENILKTSEKKDRKRDLIVGFTRELLDSNSNLFGIGVYFKPNAFDGRDAEFEKSELFEKSKGRFYLYEDVVPGVNYEDIAFENEDWYQESMESGNVISMEPYIEEGILCGTVTYPIREGSQLVGFVLVDINLDRFQEAIMKQFEERNVEGQSVTLFNEKGF